MGRAGGPGRPNALPMITRSHYDVLSAQGSTRPGYGGAQKQLKPGVQRGRHISTGQGLLSWLFCNNNNNNNKSNRYRGCGTSVSRVYVYTLWRKPTIASKKKEEGNGPGADPPALP